MKDPITEIQVIINKFEADTHRIMKEYYRHMMWANIFNNVCIIAFFLTILVTLLIIWVL